MTTTVQTQYLSVADTAKLVRKALKEAFPLARFSVTSKQYSGGASISVSWLDGPTNEQVQAITCLFEGASFNSSDDSKSYNRHTLDGQPVSFAADWIFTERRLSKAVLDQAVMEAMTTLPELAIHPWPSVTVDEQGVGHLDMQDVIVDPYPLYSRYKTEAQWHDQWAYQVITKIAYAIPDLQLQRRSPTFDRVKKG